MDFFRMHRSAKSYTIVARKSKPKRLDSHNGASGKAGAVQTMNMVRTVVATHPYKDLHLK